MEYPGHPQSHGSEYHWKTAFSVLALLAVGFLAVIALQNGFPDAPYGAALSAVASVADNPANEMCSDQYQPGVPYGTFDKATKKWGLQGLPCSGTAPAGHVITGYCVALNDCKATEVDGKPLPGLPSQLQNGDSNASPVSPTNDTQSEAATQPNSALGSNAPLAPPGPLQQDQGPCEPDGCSSAPVANITPDQSSLSPDGGAQVTPSQPTELPYSNNPIFNETTGQWESQPLQNLMNDPSLYPTTVLNQPNQLGPAFNETTGQWEGLSAPQPTYSMPVLPNNPLDPIAQQPGAVPSYTEGDQNYKYAVSDTFGSTPQPAQLNPDAPFRDYATFPQLDGQVPVQYWLNQLNPGWGDAFESAVRWPFVKLTS